MMRFFYSPNFNPIIFSIGPISLHWYGLMYVLSFMFSAWYLNRKKYNLKSIFWTKKEIENLLCLNMLGIIIGGRIGYALFYQWDFFSKNLLWIFKIWEGGMSFHGGLIGVIISIAWFSYCKNQPFLMVSDFIVPVIPIGLGLGRLGNFINGELWGRVTFDTPWAMLFHLASINDLLWIYQNPEYWSIFDYYGALPRHPSQLYEMFLEGVVLYIIMNIIIRKFYCVGSASGFFLIFYGLFRVIAEYFREPDIHLGLLYNCITLGQILSFPMIFSGLLIIYLLFKK